MYAITSVEKNLCHTPEKHNMDTDAYVMML